MGVSASTLSPARRYQLALQAGFQPGEQAITATAISLAECSSCDLSSVNSTGDIGLMQINSQHWPLFGGQAVLTDPLASMRAAFRLSNGGTDWNPWCTFWPTGCGGVNASKSNVRDNWVSALATARSAAGSNIPAGTEGQSAEDTTPGNAIVATPVSSPVSAFASLLGPFQKLAPAGMQVDLTGLLLLLGALFAIFIGALVYKGDAVKSSTGQAVKVAAMAE